jgi:lysozyme
MTILEHDLQTAIKGAERLLKGCDILDSLAKEIIIEMVFQLGETGVSKFKNMIKALEDGPDYQTAAIEMLDSKWAKQTPQRAEGMSSEMAGLG